MANISRGNLTAIIKQEAKALGFDSVGIAEKKYLRHSDYIKQWIKQGYHADMKYIAENIEKRIDISKVFNACESIIVVAENYFKPAKRDKYMHIARYAAAKDYHERIKAKLVSLAKTIQSMEPSLQYNAYVDTGPVMEKLWGLEAGIGWMGKHSILLNRDIGSWFCLGVLLVNLTLESDHPVKEECGDCTLCIESCPTGAIIEPYVVDAHRCISYLTIECKQEIPAVYSNKLNGYFFGCDLCQEACPYNSKTGTSLVEGEQLALSYSEKEIEQLLQIKEQEFKRIFSGFAIQRLGFKNLRRNMLAHH